MWVQSLEGQLPAKTLIISPPTCGQEGCRVELRAVAAAGALVLTTAPGSALQQQQQQQQG